MVQVIQDEMASLGLIGAEIAAKAPHRPNLLFRLAGSAPGPTLMLCGHSDTKPVGDRSKWDSDPFDPVVREGKLYGLGSTDMKGAVAAMIYATAAIRNSGAVLAGDLLLVVNADEELSMRFGSEYLSVEYGLRADIALLGEPSGIAGPEFEYLHLLSRGVSCCKVRVRGTQMHSSLSDRLPSLNASVKLAQVLQYMNENLELTFRPHSLCAKPTVNLGVRLDGGVGYGVYPGVAEFHADIRTLPGMTEQQLRADIERCLNSLRAQDPELNVEAEFETPPLNWLPPTEVTADHPFVEILLSSAERTLGRRPKLSAFPGGSDAAKFHALAGIPTIPSFGPGWLDLAHGPNECVGVEAVVQAARIYAEAALAYLSPERAPH